MSFVISVVVCTYNRSNLLSGCIESLCNQTLDKENYEIIIIDNNSMDNTKKVVELFLIFDNVRYVLETNPGLSYARNRGISESKGSYVAFIDDDATAASNWLEVAHQLLNTLNPKPDCIGGPYHPFYINPKPDWFFDWYEIRGFGNSPKFLRRHEQFSGSNMVWFKESLNKIGNFDINLGVVENQLRLGEETDAFEKLWRLPDQPYFYYSPELIIYHLVPVFKMKISYRLKRKFAQGQYQAYVLGSLQFFEKLNLVGITVFSLVKSILRFGLKIFSHHHWQNWIVEEGGFIAYHAGRLLGLIGIRPKIIQDT